MATEISLTDDEITILWTRLKAAQDYRDERWDGADDPDCANLMQRPDKWISLVRGSYWQDKVGLSQTPYVRRPINRILPKLRTKQDMLCAGDTSFLVEPREERFVGNEDDVAALLVSDWDVLGFDEEVEAARWDSDLFGYGVVELGWYFERDDEQLQGERGEPVVPEGAESMVAPDGTMFPPIPVEQNFETEEDAQAAARVTQVAEERIIWGEPEVDDPFVERFSPRDLLVDPNAQRWDLSDAHYVFRVRYEPQEAVRRNKRYTGASEIIGTVYSVREAERGLGATIEQAARDDRALVELYDGYSWMWQKGKEVLMHVILAKGQEEPLLVRGCRYLKGNGVPMFRRNPFPFRIMPGTIVDQDYWMPESAVEQAASVQLQYDESWNQLNEHRRKSNRQWFYRKDTLTPEQIKLLEEGEDGKCIPAAGAPEEFFWPVPYEPVAKEVYDSLEPLDQEMGRQLGVSQFEESVIPAKDVRAAEVHALREGNARNAGDARRYRRFRSDIATCLLTLYQKFADRSRSYSAVTEDGRQRWGALNAVDLRGMRPMGDDLEEIGIQYQVKVNVDNEEPRNKQTEKELWKELLAILLPLGQTPDPERPGMPMVNVKALVRAVLKRFDIKNLSDIIPSAPSPQEQAQMAQAQQGQAAMAAQIQGMQGKPPPSAEGIPGNGGGGMPGRPPMVEMGPGVMI